jgi:hypothetical protein
VFVAFFDACRDEAHVRKSCYIEKGLASAMCLLAAFLVSLVSERKTGQVRAAMMRMCAPRTDREARDRG